MKSILKYFLLHLLTLLIVNAGYGFTQKADSINHLFFKPEIKLKSNGINFSFQDTLIRPKITLFGEWINTGKGGADKVYNYFSLNDDGVKRKTGKNYKELKSYILRDTEAGIIFNDCVKKKKSSVKCAIFAVISFIPFATLILKDIESPVISLSALAFTAFIIGSIVLGKKSSKLLRKSVRTYNRNSGYGNVCGDDLRP